MNYKQYRLIEKTASQYVYYLPDDIHERVSMFKSIADEKIPSKKEVRKREILLKSVPAGILGLATGHFLAPVANKFKNKALVYGGGAVTGAALGAVAGLVGADKAYNRKRNEIMNYRSIMKLPKKQINAIARDEVLKENADVFGSEKLFKKYISNKPVMINLE